jgi:hypothetical protein
MGGVRTTIPFVPQQGQPSVAGTGAAAKRASSVLGPTRSTDIPQGDHEVKAYETEHGIASGHIRPLAGLANRENIAFVLHCRPGCAELAQLGHPPAPPELQHAVAQDFGPLSGLVPANPALSTIDHRNGEAVAATKATIDKLVENDEAARVDVHVPASGVDTWSDHGVPVRGRLPNKRKTFSKDGRQWTFIAEPVVDKSGERKYRILVEGEPVKVVARLLDDRPIEYIGAYHLTALSTPPHLASGNDSGTPTLAERVAGLNHSIGRAPSNPAIYPAPKGSAGFHPCLVFAPQKINGVATGIDGVAYAATPEAYATLTGMISRAGLALEAVPQAETPRTSRRATPSRERGQLDRLLQKLDQRPPRAKL